MAGEEERDQFGQFRPGHNMTLWRLRRSWGSPPRYKDDPEGLWNKCCEYFQWVLDNPLEETKVFHTNGAVTQTNVPKMRAMTHAGLRVFIGVSGETWRDWRNPERRPDICEVVETVDTIIYEQKFTGAAADLFNASIIARELGLVEKKEVESNLKVVIEEDDSNL